MGARTLACVALALLAHPRFAAAQARAGDARDLEKLQKGEMVAGLPPADSITQGPRTVPAGAHVSGTIVARGPVSISGEVDGSVVSLAGDVSVNRGGHVTGDVIAVGGRVIADSGIVDGEMRSMGSLPSLVPAASRAVVALTPTQRTLQAVRLAAGTFAVLLIIALGVVLFAGPNLDEVVGTLASRFGRAFWVGLLGQLLILPGLLVLVVALAVSIIGILLIPFAVVAYAVAVAGLVTLGCLAVARLVGDALVTGGNSARTRSLQALAIGLVLFFALWMIAAVLVWAPLAASVVRAAALAATWAAMTLGLGAAILSRAGTSRRLAGGRRPVELAAWQTPTPVTGVVAARRPVAATGEGSHR